jgi:hypothetical protein
MMKKKIKIWNKTKPKTSTKKKIKNQNKTTKILNEKKF